MGANLMRKTDLAEYLGVSTRTVDRWRAAGLLKAVVIHGTIRFRPEDAERLVERGQKGRGIDPKAAPCPAAA